MLQWGTPLDLDMYWQWSDYYRRVAEGQREINIPNCITALPMAGMGSRFSTKGYLLPKPCIEINGHYMMDRALHCLPKTDEVILGALKKHMDLLPLEEYGNVVWIDEVLQGQACTTEKIVEIVESDTSILVSACDNGVLYDGDKLLELVNDPGNDIIVWSYKNNYTSYYNPNAYSWLDVDGKDNVTKVNVKNFTGDNPLDTPAITGTMFFKNKDVYLNSLQRLYEVDAVGFKNVRTNGEFYIDEVLNSAIDLGYTVKNFDVDHYICWGTPDDLETYRYWQKFFDKVKWHPYEYTKDFFTN